VYHARMIGAVPVLWDDQVILDTVGTYGHL